MKWFHTSKQILGILWIDRYKSNGDGGGIKRSEGGGLYLIEVSL